MPNEQQLLVLGLDALGLQRGEKPSSYLLNLEKERAMNRSITHLRDDAGTLLSNQKDISDFQVSFFRKLYADPRVSQNTEKIRLSHDDIQAIPRLNPPCRRKRTNLSRIRTF